MNIEEVYKKYKHFSSFIHDVKKIQTNVDIKQGFNDSIINLIMFDCFIAIEEYIKSKC